MIVGSGITITSGVQITSEISALYPFSTFTFTTGSTVGPTGANVQWLFANSYSSSNAGNVWLTNTTYYGVSKPGYQYWVVPETAQYTIEVAGSRSGIPTYTANTVANIRYGRGAVVRATFTLQQGTNVTIAVGQPSANTTQPSTFSSPGGGGGFGLQSHPVPRHGQWQEFGPPRGGLAGCGTSQRRHKGGVA